jgi:endonuclease YncB( thermonuclease family)
MHRSLAIVSVLIFFALPQAFASESTMADLLISDGSGALVHDFKLGDIVSIQSAVNHSEIEQEFVYIVQIQDSEGYAIFLSWASGTLQDGYTPSISWKPERAGTYAVQAFIWTSIDSPAPLSFATQKSSIDVNECAGTASCFAGTVTRVTDGDTLRVDDIAIRLSLVNTPERGDAGYSEASAFTAAMCPVGSTARVDEDDGQTGGSFGRMVAKVYCGGKVLNEELLLAGHAEIYSQFCDVSEFAREGWAARYC